MLLHERNRMLQILHRNRAKRKQIAVIMEDLDQSGIFDDPFEEEQDEWFLIEEKAKIWFSKKKPNEKIKALKSIKQEIKGAGYNGNPDNFLDIETRIRFKQAEYIKKGLVKAGPPSPIKRTGIVTRYGRSPLHEAIAMRDIKTIKKLLKAGKYLEDRDNNGHTAMEMAFYENYTEALILFAFHRKNKKTG